MPKGQKTTRAAQIDLNSEQSDFDPEYHLPEVELRYLLDVLSEIGEAKVGEKSLMPIEWIDIKSWADLTGSNLTPREYSVLKMLSHVYVRQYNESLEVNCPSPHLARLPDSATVEQKLKSLFAMFRKD